MENKWFCRFMQTGKYAQTIRSSQYITNTYNVFFVLLGSDNNLGQYNCTWKKISSAGRVKNA